MTTEEAASTQMLRRSALSSRRLSRFPASSRSLAFSVTLSAVTMTAVA